MENKYKLKQGSKNYCLTTKVNKEKLIFICKELNSYNPLVFVGDYFLAELKQLCSLLASTSNIYEAQIIFDNIMTNQKVSLEFQIDYINLKIFIKKISGIEEYFSIRLNLFNKMMNTQKLIYLPKSLIRHSDSSEKLMKNQNDNSRIKTILYSPLNINRKKIIQLPARNVKNLNTENAKINSYNYNFDNLHISKSKQKIMDKITLSLCSKPVIINNNNRTLIQSISAKNINSSFNINKEYNIRNNELENLKNENNILKDLINKLRNDNEMLSKENKNLQIKNNEIKNGYEAQIMLLKTEKEKFDKEIGELKNTFEEYKNNKIKEIDSLNQQIESLLINLNLLKENEIKKEKEINELKLSIDQLKKEKKEQIENKLDMNKEILTIHTRLEIIKGDIIQDVKELELLTRKICKNNNKISLNLLYKATVDSDKAEIFHKKCDSAKSTLVLIKSENDKRFGGYTNCSWEGNSIEKKDNDAFVFSLDKMSIYDIIPEENAIGCYPKYGPVFLGCQIRIYDQFFTRGGTTYEKETNYNTKEDFELTGGLEEFKIKDIEVYSVEIE